MLRLWLSARWTHSRRESRISSGPFGGAGSWGAAAARRTRPDRARAERIMFPPGKAGPAGILSKTGLVARSAALYSTEDRDPRESEEDVRSPRPACRPLPADRR